MRWIDVPEDVFPSAGLARSVSCWYNQLVAYATYSASQETKAPTGRAPGVARPHPRGGSPRVARSDRAARLRDGRPRPARRPHREGPAHAAAHGAGVLSFG